MSLEPMVEPPPNAENSRTRSPASDGKKWGVASIRADDCFDSSAQTSRLAVPPRAGTSWSLCESLGGLAELKTISSPSALQAPPPPPKKIELGISQTRIATPP